MKNLYRHISKAMGTLLIASGLSLDTLAREGSRQRAQTPQPQQSPTLDESLDFVVENVEFYGYVSGSSGVHQIEHTGVTRVEKEEDCVLLITGRRITNFMDSPSLYVNTYRVPLWGVTETKIVTWKGKDNWYDDDNPDNPFGYTSYNVDINTGTKRVIKTTTGALSTSQFHDYTTMPKTTGIGISNQASIYLNNQEIAERVKTALDYAVNLCQEKKKQESF